MVGRALTREHAAHPHDACLPASRPNPATIHQLACIGKQGACAPRVNLAYGIASMQEVVGALLHRVRAFPDDGHRQ